MHQVWSFYDKTQRRYEFSNYTKVRALYTMSHLPQAFEGGLSHAYWGPSFGYLAPLEHLAVAVQLTSGF